MQDVPLLTRLYSGRPAISGVGCTLAVPRLFTSTELRGKRATYSDTQYAEANPLRDLCVIALCPLWPTPSW